MAFEPPERFNIADYFLDARVRDGRGDRTAILCDGGPRTYLDVQRDANRFGNLLLAAGVQPEQRVIIALRDRPEFVAAFFGALKIGAVVVMLNPDLPVQDIAYFLEYTRARVALVESECAGPFGRAAERARHLARLLILGSRETEAELAEADEALETFPSHRDDGAIWLFSGGTTGRPKAVVQTHTSFANTTDCYARQVIGYRESDVTLSVPKLYFGYATGSNLLFPFAAGAACALFPERCTAEAIFRRIAQFRPTVLINVPTMIQHMVSHPEGARQDLSSLRLATSAGEALPVELHARWMELFGVELLDGLGTAEMWHIFISNRPGAVRPGTLGQVVPGFEVKVCDESGQAVPDGEVGWLWVRGNSRALGYWHEMEKTRSAFRGEWYVSGDLLRRDGDGYFTYSGRADDLLKVGGKWLAPQELEGCLLQHPAVIEAAVVGVIDAHGLTKPHAFVVARGPTDGLAEALQAFARDRLEPYKQPRVVTFVETLPRTHLGKVDRGKLRQG